MNDTAMNNDTVMNNDTAMSDTHLGSGSARGPIGATRGPIGATRGPIGAARAGSGPARRPLRFTAALILLTVGGLSGCGSAATPADSTVISTEPAAAPAPSDKGSVAQSGIANAASTPQPTSDPGDMPLGDQGLGDLVLGMSVSQAVATGLVDSTSQPSTGSSRCTVHQGLQGIDLVYMVDGKVSIIAVGKSIRLVTGIGVGDTYEALHAKYPNAKAGDARIWIPAPGAPVPASYRIGLDDDAYPDSRITEIALQADDQACYE